MPKWYAQEIGPLPAYAWAGIVAAGVGFGIWERRRASAGAPAILPAEVTGVANSGDGTGGISASGGGTVSPPGAPAPTTNDEWLQAAARDLIGRGYDPTLAYQALADFLGGNTLSTQENAIVALALQHIGPPPTQPPPPVIGPDPTQPPVTTPPVTIPPPTPRPRPNPSPGPHDNTRPVRPGAPGRAGQPGAAGGAGAPGSPGTASPGHVAVGSGPGNFASIVTGNATATGGGRANTGGNTATGNASRNVTITNGNGVSKAIQRLFATPAPREKANKK